MFRHQSTTLQAATIALLALSAPCHGQIAYVSQNRSINVTCVDRASGAVIFNQTQSATGLEPFQHTVTGNCTSASQTSTLEASQISVTTNGGGPCGGNLYTCGAVAVFEVVFDITAPTTYVLHIAQAPQATVTMRGVGLVLDAGPNLDATYAGVLAPGRYTIAGQTTANGFSANLTVGMLIVSSSVVASGGGISSGPGVSIRGTAGQYDVGCSTSPSVTVCAGYWPNGDMSSRCPADLDDGSGTGMPDGGVTIEDLLYYLVIFNAGDARADLDDGSGTGTRDGGVTIEDLLYMLAHYQSGC